jgi:Immunity protein Imm6
MIDLTDRLKNMNPQTNALISLAIAYLAFPQLASKPEHQLEAKLVLDAATKSVLDNDITGKDLSNMLWADDDTGLLILAHVSKDDPTYNAWRVIGTAIAFVAWIAYKMDGDALLSEVTMNTLNLLRDYAILAGISEVSLTNMVNLALQSKDKMIRIEDLIEVALSGPDPTFVSPHIK